VQNGVTRKNPKFGFVTRGHFETGRGVGSCLFLSSGGEERGMLDAQFARLKDALKIR
jgi:hypothetical protein